MIIKGKVRAKWDGKTWKLFIPGFPFVLNHLVKIFKNPMGREPAYSEVSIKRPALLNVLFSIFIESLY